MFQYHAVLHLNSGNLSAVYQYSDKSNDHDAVAHGRAAAILNDSANDRLEGTLMVVSGPDNDIAICLVAKHYVIGRDADGNFGAEPA